jgi:DNA-binding FadR family transcriptional regulator
VPRFTTVQTSNKHEIIAGALEAAILTGELQVGDKLPSEQRLAEQFGVSRSIVREALRDIEARGLLEAKNGSGSFVSSPTSADLGGMLNRILVLSGAAIDDYFEIRFALEVKACELAALRATREDLGELGAIVRKMEMPARRREELTRLDYEFHFAVAKAARNPLFGCLLQPLKGAMLRMFDRGYAPGALDEALAGHIRIVDALRGKDPELARKAMARHIEFAESNLARLSRQDGAP